MGITKKAKAQRRYRIPVYLEISQEPWKRHYQNKKHRPTALTLQILLGLLQPINKGTEGNRAMQHRSNLHILHYTALNPNKYIQITFCKTSLIHAASSSLQKRLRNPSAEIKFSFLRLSSLHSLL